MHRHGVRGPLAKKNEKCSYVTDGRRVVMHTAWEKLRRGIEERVSLNTGVIGLS